MPRPWSWPSAPPPGSVAPVGGGGAGGSTDLTGVVPGVADRRPPSARTRAARARPAWWTSPPPAGAEMRRRPAASVGAASGSPVGSRSGCSCFTLLLVAVFAGGLLLRPLVRHRQLVRDRPRRPAGHLPGPPGRAAVVPTQARRPHRGDHRGRCSRVHLAALHADVEESASPSPGGYVARSPGVPGPAAAGHRRDQRIVGRTERDDPGADPPPTTTAPRPHHRGAAHRLRSDATTGPRPPPRRRPRRRYRRRPPPPPPHEATQPRCKGRRLMGRRIRWLGDGHDPVLRA